MKHEHDPAVIEQRINQYARTADPGGLSTTMFRGLMRAKVIRELDAEADARIAEAAGTTVEAIREAERQKALGEWEGRHATDLAIARAIVGLPASALRRRDPRQMVTAAAVEAKRAELSAMGEPHGERSIARALGVGRDAVRYALGKDR